MKLNQFIDLRRKLTIREALSSEPEGEIEPYNIELPITITEYGAIVKAFVNNQVAHLLVDSGASSTIICPTLLKDLSPLGKEILHNFESEVVLNAFKISMTFKQGEDEVVIPDILVYENSIPFGCDKPFHGLLGRDVLENCVFQYDGVEKQAYLRIYAPA